MAEDFKGPQGYPGESASGSSGVEGANKKFLAKCEEDVRIASECQKAKGGEKSSSKKGYD